MRKFLLFFGDIVVLYISLFLTLVIRYGKIWQSQIDIHFWPFTILFILWIIIFYVLNLYEPRISRNNSLFYSTLFKSIFVSGLISIAFFYIVPFLSIAPKTNLLIFILVSSGLLAIWRNLHNDLLTKTTLHKNTVFVGLNEQTMEISKFLSANPQFGFKPLYILDTQTNSAFSFIDVDFKKIDTMNDIQKILEKESIKTVVLSPQAYQLPHMVDVFYKNLGRGIEFFNLSYFYENISGKVPLDSITQTWFLENVKDDKKFYSIMKRFIDIVGVIILGVFTLILTPLIALAIKWVSKGPIFYKQKRTGQGGRIFEMIKFRSMISNDPTGGAEDQTGATWSQKNDPRITKIGRFLRKTRLDELPQILNILKGEMSFVGPRAERPEFHSDLVREVPFYEARYLVKPGATGWAQLQKDYYSSVSDMKERLKYDLYYIKNRTITLDLGILLKTLNVIIRGGGR